MDGESKQVFQKLFTELENINKKLDKVDDRLDKVDSRLDKVDSRLDKVENRLDKVDSRLDKVDNRLDVIELKQDKTASKLQDLQLDVKIAERNLRQDIHLLQDASETVEQVLKLNELIPR